MSCAQTTLDSYVLRYIAYYICELVSFFTERSFDFVVVIDVVKHNHAKAPMFRSFVDLFYKKSMFLVS